MTLTREDVLLADRYEKDLLAYKVQQAKVNRLRGEVWEALVKKHNETVRGEEGKLHRLKGELAISAGKKEALSLTVDEAVRREVDAAELDQRIVNGKIPEVAGALNNSRTTLKRLVDGKAFQNSIDGQKKIVKEIEKELAGLMAASKKADGRVDAARKAFLVAVDAIRKDRLEQE